MRNLELIGEAANNIPKQIQEMNTSVPWRQVIATRNRLIHGYLGIDNDILWSIIQDVKDAMNRIRLSNKSNDLHLTTALRAHQW